MAGRCRHHGCNHRGESPWRPESLERCSLRLMQCRGSGAHGMAHWALLRFGFQTGQAAQRAGIGSGSDHRDRCLGIGGAIAFKLFHSTTTPILTTWQHWFASDGLGIITVAPLLIELASASRDRPPLSELVEGALAVAALALVSGLAIFLRSELLATVGPVAVLFAPLLWLAARCRPVFAAAAAFIVSLSIVWTTTFGIGYFGNPGLSMAERVLAAQVSILLVTIGASVLAALFAEIRDKRRLAEAALHASETQRYLIETERLAALGGLVAGVAHEINSPVGISLTVASTLAHRSANFADQIVSGPVRRSLLAEFTDGCRDAANQLVANLQRAGELIQSFKQVAVDRSMPIGAPSTSNSRPSRSWPVCGRACRNLELHLRSRCPPISSWTATRALTGRC